jgi:hypothetical protein
MAFNVQETLQFIGKNKEFIDISNDLFKIFNKRITPYIKKRLDNDIKGSNTRNEAKGRIAAINVLPQIVNKKSQVYRANAYRKMLSGGTEAQLTGVVEETNYKTALEMANKMLNLHSCVAIEPVLNKENENPFFRVIPANKFLVKGDGTIDNVVTEFIKVISTKTLQASDGIVFETEFEAYTKEEFVRFNSKGEILENRPNEYGIIPVAYFTRDTVTLMPEPDEDSFNMVTLLPLIMTDLNFAIKYQCFSIFYTMNCRAKNMTISPNAVWNFEGTGQEGDKPEIGMLTPSAKVEDVLSAIRTQYSMWLEEKGLKLNSLADGSEPLSGIAKAIDMADVTNDINYQRGLFIQAEKDLLAIWGKMQHNAEWKVDVGFEPTSIFEETPSEKVDRLIKKVDANLMSLDQAIKEANQHMSREAVEAMEVKILANMAEKQRLAQEEARRNGPFQN